MKLALTFYILFALFLTSMWSISVAEAFSSGQLSLSPARSVAAVAASDDTTVIPELSYLDLYEIDRELSMIGNY